MLKVAWDAVDRAERSIICVPWFEDRTYYPHERGNGANAN